MKISRRDAIVGSAAIAATRCAPASTTRDGAKPTIGDAATTADVSLPDASTVFAAPGRVIEVKHSGSVVGGLIAAPVQQMATRGIVELTGESNETAAWAKLFEPADVVAIKVNPFGYPKFYSHPETVASIIRGLNLVGIPNQNIIIYDRYTDFLAQVGYDTLLPPGVRLASATMTSGSQVDVSAYDLGEYVEFAKVDRRFSPYVLQNRRSYLSKVITSEATKVINVPVVKSHYTAGVTAALKNMTYGLVNNTARTHPADGSDNWTIDFLPAVASMPALRNKVVLHVVDLLVGCYDKGPDPSDVTFDYASLMFSTDPVAVDRICWNIVDAARASQGLPPVADFQGAEPQYILRCAELGLGISDLNAIDHRMIVLA
jgi:uncharacterized protein (DUF362 family)